MLDSVLTLIAATDGETMIEAAALAAHDALAGLGARVDQPDWLAPRKACDILFSDIARYRAGARTRKLIAKRFPGAKLDLVVQEAADRRKRLVVADLESTLIENEMLDELADFIGVRDKVAEITRQAMNGEIDFARALKTRVALFRDLPETTLGEAATRIRLMPGASIFVATLRAHGAHVALVTGGFGVFARHVGTLLRFDAVISNEILAEGGRLTGRVREPILTREGKRTALISLAGERGVPLRLTLAIGDGANDLPMLEAAGLGVAFRAKPAVAERARNRVDYCDLTAILYAQGYRASEFAAGPLPN
ncbi:phosphoserine phosphatase SerB [Methylocella sp.]|jgi:phosphoserine phosphatase|uniref:phosphoserine phosphatase SerB n=1 Tax=Methylocella sp. TaxID=1978226 RepID=UPI003C2127FA